MERERGGERDRWREREMEREIERPKETWEKCQIQNLKNCLDAKWPVLLFKILIFFKCWHFYYI